MARRIRAKEILRLHEGRLSQDPVAAAGHMSKHSVQNVLEAASEHGLSWEDAKGMSNSEVYARLFPGKEPPGPTYPGPDWKRARRELAKTGVTPRLLHAEYAAGEAAMSHGRHCRRYKAPVVSKDAVGRVGHKAGRTLGAGWSGPTMRLVDSDTGGRQGLPVRCLLAVQPVQPRRTDAQHEACTWLRCHVHAFGFFGGGAPAIVPDNLKTDVVRHPRDGEVWSAATYVIAALRGEVFADMASLRAAVAAKVAKHNAKPFSKRDGSRLQCFLEEEKPLPRPLPQVPYETRGRACGRRAQADCHVSYRRNFYSVSHLLVGREVDLRVTESKLEVFCGGELVAAHPLFPPHARNRCPTDARDPPEGRSSRPGWDAPRVRRWAERIGPSCRECVDRPSASYAPDEQAFNGCPAPLGPSDGHSAPRFEHACSMAPAAGKRSPRHRDAGPAPKADRDKLADAEAAGDGAERPDAPGYVRGASSCGEDRA